MLQNRKIIFILMQLIIAFVCTEQRLKPQKVSPVERRNFQQPNMRQLDLQQKLVQERELKIDEMIRNMNFRGEPCKDFYDYACGKWLPRQFSYLASKGEVISVESLMAEDINKELQDVLIEPITSLDSMDTRVAKNYYAACLNESAASSKQKQFVRSFALNYGGLPDVKSIPWPGNYNWLNVIADLRRKYNLDILIGLSIDNTSPNHKAIYIEEPKTTLLPPEICSSLASRQVKENNEKLLQLENKIKTNFLKWFDMTEVNAKRKAKTIIGFELDLCKYMRTEQMSFTSVAMEENQQAPGFRYSTNISLQNLRQISDYYLINFKDFVEISLNTKVVSQIYFRSEEYFQQLKNLNQKGLEATFANYIMYRSLEEINFPLNEKPEQRPFYCTQQVIKYLPQVLGKLYDEKYNLEDKKKDVREIFLNIKQAISNHVENNIDWLSENTKKIINQKLKNLNIIFPLYAQDPDILKGLPLHDVLRGLPVQDNQTYWQKLQIIMMYKANQTIQQLQGSTDKTQYLEIPPVSLQIKPLTNELIVSYGLLEKPFYSHLHSKAFKYSSIGVSIAKEIIKMFDLQDPFNNYPYDPSALQHFYTQSECVRLQISYFLYNKPFVYRNASKVRDILMETSAINMAFKAYLNWLDVKGRPESELQLETLPDIDITNTQLFFINYAQSRCSARVGVELAPKFLPLFRRNIQQYDVNGPLINSKEFSRDFACVLGLNMNLDDKCLLY